MKRASVVGVRAAIAAAVSAAVLVAVAVIWRGSQAIRTATEQVRAEHEFGVTVQPYAPATNLGFEVVSSPQIFLQAARFQDHLFIAGPAGLLEYEPDGVLLRQYLVGSDLPGSPLVALVPSVLSDSHEPELLVATASEGILAFNGRAFRQILPANADARGINAILPVPSGHLLIGTKKRGVLIYDGKKISVLHPALDGMHVTVLAGDESDLWVGTLNRGVIHFHGGQAETFTEEQGLPDLNVQSLAVAGEKTYVGTVSGVAIFDGGRFSRVLAPGVFATAVFPTSTDLYVGGYGFQAGAHRDGWNRGITQTGFGVNFKKSLSNPGPWRFSFGGFGECLPNHNNYVELDRSKVDVWGIPTPKIHCGWSENELALRKDMAISAAEMLAAVGGREIEPFVRNDPPGFAIHEMGTARMGRDPKTSVLNSFNQAHDVKNLFITDGGAMVSSSCVNPSLTYMALTARACDYAVRQTKKGEL